VGVCGVCGSEPRAVAKEPSRVAALLLRLLLLLMLLFPASVDACSNFLIKPPTGSTVAQC